MENALSERAQRTSRRATFAPSTPFTHLVRWRSGFTRATPGNGARAKPLSTSGPLENRRDSATSARVMATWVQLRIHHASGGWLWGGLSLRRERNPWRSVTAPARSRQRDQLGRLERPESIQWSQVLSPPVLRLKTSSRPAHRGTRQQHFRFSRGEPHTHWSEARLAGTIRRCSAREECVNGSRIRAGT